MQPYSRPSNLNTNGFCQVEQNFHIQNEFQYNRNINQDDQFIEQKRTNIQQHNNVQEVRSDFPNNNNLNDDENQNTQQFETTQQQLRAIYLFALLESVIAIILITFFYYIKSLQQYLIDENTLQLNKLTFYCMNIPIFVLLFIIFIVYSANRNPPEEFNKIAILTYTLVFQYTIVCYGIFQFKKLNQGFLYIQITQGLIVLILIIFIVRPKYSFNLRSYFLIVIVSTLFLVLFMSIFFEDLKFWWMFGVPVIAYFFALKLQIFCWIDQSQNNSILVLIHYGIFQLMILVFVIIIIIQKHLQ
ncbi:unnamed protein product [Paramecium sonneborni]|uniref:Transmembrane protein n=1 Tax=Paramecium sonneborni TaxID=65129 RepID=A0A8S1P2N0_9CILI|nr:unnamed protein product [Paramecium sonneborni]